jgi:hypothetical protein
MNYDVDSGPEIAVIPSYGANGAGYGKRESNVSYCGKLLTPRISFTDEMIGKLCKQT